MAFFTPFAFREQRDLTQRIPFPDIVTDGLVWYMDSDNTDSYPGTGTIVKNLVNLTHTGSLNNVNVDTSGSLTYFDFPDTTLNNIQFSSISDIQLANEYSIVVWTYAKDDFNQAIIAKTAAAAGTTTNWAIDFSGARQLRTFYYNGTTPVITAASTDVDIDNKWGMVTVTFNTGSTKIYTNTTERGSSTSGLTSTNTSTNPLYIGSRGNVQPYSGSVSVGMIYNKELNTTEIEQNFNAYSASFGL